MPRFYFQLVGDLPVEDDEGEEFPTREAAVEEARKVVLDFIHNYELGDLRRRTLRVTDETGAEVATLAITERS
jgi:hypothetical protein